MLGNQSKQKADGKGEATEPNELAAVADREYDPWPDQVELFLDAQGPEMATEENDLMLVEVTQRLEVARTLGQGAQGGPSEVKKVAEIGWPDKP